MTPRSTCENGNSGKDFWDFWFAARQVATQSLCGKEVWPDSGWPGVGNAWTWPCRGCRAARETAFSDSAGYARAFNTRVAFAYHTNPTRERGNCPWPGALARASGWCGRCRCRTVRHPSVNRSKERMKDPPVGERSPSPAFSSKRNKPSSVSRVWLICIMSIQVTHCAERGAGSGRHGPTSPRECRRFSRAMPNGPRGAGGGAATCFRGDTVPR